MLAKTARHAEVDESASTSPEANRRRRPRMKLSLPVVLIQSNGAIRVETLTEDVSCDSFFCVSYHRFQPDECVECQIRIPAGPNSFTENDLCLQCRARVVRVVSQGPQQGFGIACRLEDYTIRPHAR